MIIGDKVTNPGQLRTRIRLLERSVEVEAGGFQVPVMEEVAEVWSRWINAHGHEAWIAYGAQAENPATVLIRYRSDLDPTWVIERNGLLFEIISIDNIQERNEYIELKVKRWRPG